MAERAGPSVCACEHRWLPAESQARLVEVAGRIARERRFEGVAGLTVTDEMRLTVAGVAGLMALGHDDPYLFDRVPAILLRPAAFTPGGRDHGPDTQHLGEAWRRGPVVLSWRDTLRSARQPGRGDNLVLHEFAHHLDDLNGDMDGAPALVGADRGAWSLVAGREYDRLVAQSRRQEVTLLDHYGASNPAEFFAVATECFFERPHEMKRRHAELYWLLERFYRQDPTEWAPPPERPSRRREARREAPLTRVDVSGLGLSEADAAFTEGHELLAAGRYDAARRAFDRALALEPDDAEALALRATTRLELGDDAGAGDDARRAMALDPRHTPAHTAAAEAAIAAGDDEAAERYARAALRLDKDDADGLLFCGLLAVRRGEAREALRLLKRLVALDRYSDEAHYWLACAYDLAGDEAAARRHFERADWLAENPEAENQSDAAGRGGP